MLLALRRIVDVGSAIPFRIGVNRGPVFAGDVGPRYRRTYTVMGDAVNLAARVMAKAHPGQVLATGSILDASDIRFETQALEPFMVKGKRDPVTAFLVGPIADVQVHSRRGRSSARRAPGGDRRDRRCDGGRQGGPRPHDRDRRSAGDRQDAPAARAPRSRAEAFEHLEATCELYAQGTAYAPFRALLRDALDIDRQVHGEDAAQLLRIKVSRGVAGSAPVAAAARHPARRRGRADARGGRARPGVPAREARVGGRAAPATAVRGPARARDDRGRPLDGRRLGCAAVEPAAEDRGAGRGSSRSPAATRRPGSSRPRASAP